MLMVINVDTSKLSINNESEHDNKDLANAVARLRAEARQTMANTSRGLRNVTEEFSAASSQLVAGQLVKDEFFTLFEAVGALEASQAFFLQRAIVHGALDVVTRPKGSSLTQKQQIMDPKMDSGYVPPVRLITFGRLLRVGTNGFRSYEIISEGLRKLQILMCPRTILLIRNSIHAPLSMLPK